MNVKADEGVSSSVDNSTISSAEALRNRNSPKLANGEASTAGPNLSDKVLSEVRFKDTIEENEDYIANVMTSSYTEISFEQETQDRGSKETLTDINELSLKAELETSESKIPEDCEGSSSSDSRDRQRPNSLILTSNSENALFGEPDLLVQTETENAFSTWARVHRGQQTSDSQVSIDGSPSMSSEEILSMGHRRTGSDTSGLSELPGTLILDGDVITFVAEDLQEKIRLSSPLSRRDTPSFPSSRVSTPSLYKQALQPHVPLVDAGALADLEAHATRVASGVHNMLENLSGTVQSISSLTVDCMETYEKSVCKTCDMVDGNIKSMYQLMAKCEELSNSMKPLYKVSEEIKEMKRLLDLFENIVEQKS